ncbi:MAG TPA: rhomboid family intramembrane serine protease [Planctomycetota bacterium]|nr:rhomboid family intramembrane serine protease [Planctomycetota bacterium]
MTYENRDYAKRDGYPDQSWTRAVQWIVIANVVVFLATFLGARSSVGNRELFNLLALVPYEVTSGHRIWQLLTYAFVHENPFQLIVNMYILWVAGRHLEFLYGPWRFLRFYLGAALFSSLLYVAFAYYQPAIRAAPMLGASGAAMAVLVVYASYHPGDKILLYLLYEVPIWLGVIVMVGTDLAIVAQAGESGRVAAGCYVAGAAFGFGWHKLGDKLDAILQRIPARTPAVRVTRRSSPLPPAPVKTTSALEAELDDVLRKLHEKGMGGLSEDDKGVLERASKHYRGER